MSKLFLTLTFITLFFTNFSSAQDQAFYKHPKVIEVEMMLTKEATSFVQQRLPNEKVFVNVEVEPLRRKSGDKNEQLPYFYSDEEVSDEWDAIDTPMVILLSRIKKATLKVEVPSTISDLEIIDLKEKLFQQLKLIPGRDSISIDRKIMTAKTNENRDFGLYYFIGGIATFLLVGLFFIARYGAKQNAQVSTASSANQSSSANSSAPMRPTSSKGSTFSANSIVNSKVNGDINFKDSIRAADMLKEKLHGVVNSPVFPLLSDMLILEELANKSLNSFGAFVFEMPRKHQQKVFFRGRSEKWFKGYIEAASVDMDCFLAVEKMLRNRTPSGSEKWEELLIQVWRLEDDAHLFLKQIPADEAFSILAHLPKSFSVPMAKKAFPGGWARILEAKEVPPIDDELKVEDYVERTLQLKPYFSFKSIDDYRKELELVDYLRITSVKDEEDIYESLSSESHIHNIRPPFYIVFRTENDEFKTLLEKFDLADWALATLNAPRDYIKKITSNLDDKKRYLFSTYLKQLDETPPSLSEQIEIREEIGKTYKQITLAKKSVKLAEVPKEEEGHEDEVQAA